MTKTTFLGYVPSLKSKHEATIVNGRAMKSKGGSIRYLLEGEYDGRKTLPKTVSKEDFVKVYGFDAKEAESVVVGSPSPADVEPPAPSEKPFPQEPSNENFSAEEKEESDEPKTQEFTVVLQEGDKLELTDIPEEKEEEVSEENEEEQAAPEDEKTEKEAESRKTRTFVVSSVDYETDEYDQDELDLPQDFVFVLDVDGIHGIGDTTDMQEIADEIVDDISDETGWLVSGFYFQERMPDGTLVDLDAEMERYYEAVQAKVTRPVKEDETEDEEEESDEEGLSTGAKVALGVGALAVGAAIFGAEDDDPYANQTDYSRIYEATSGRGEIDHDRIDSEEMRLTIMRHDNPYTDYDWESDKDLSEDEQLILEEYIEDEVGTYPEKGERDFNIDVEDKEVYVQTDTVYGEGRFYDFAAEHESESDGYTYAYTKGHKDGMDNEVVYRPSIETDREKTIFKKILKQKAETFEAEGWVLTSPRMGRSGVFTTKDDAEKVKAWHEKHGNVKGVEIVKANANDGNLDNRSKQILLGSETVGSPSPSGPSSTPEPAEATGSEPSNEEFKGENRNLAIGLTAAGVGLVALLGADRIKKLFDRFNL